MCFVVPAWAYGDEKTQSATVDYPEHIQPIFRSKCYSCHGADEQESGLRLDVRKRAFNGGDHGVAIIRGNSGGSPLFLRVAALGDDERMPPEEEGTPLTSEELALVRDWIDQGAVWPETDEKTGGGDHWSLQPIESPRLPQVKNTKWIQNGIDTFVLSKLEREKVDPSPAASRPALIRRVYLDLVGLPPPVEEWNRWMTDSGSDWYERLVDHLLSSPHYGERWGRHWLDVARYADSDGYEKDKPRPHAWRWRDWVIDAFNSDKPFDQFTIEQLAGDLLPNASLEQKVATGFHRNTLINREGGTDPEEDRVKRTVDRTNTIGTVWLGLTVQCCQCHSHKYDPLTQQEYYQLYAFFNTLTEPDIGAPLPHEVPEYHAAKATFDKKHKKFLAAIRKYDRSKLATSLEQWERLQSPASSLQPLSPVWTILKPESFETEKGTILEISEDGSIFASGENPGRAETLALVCNTNLEGITGVRIEAMADERLPGGGPGRDPLGNFHLTMFEMTAAPSDKSAPAQSVELANAQADFSEPNHDVKKAINNAFSSGWSIGPRTGQSHVATFETKEPIGFAGGTILTISMRQSSTLMLYHNLGRFRISVTTVAEKPLPLYGITDMIAETLTSPATERTRMQQQDLVDYYRMVDPELAKLRSAAEKHDKRAPKDPYKTTKAQVVAEMKSPRKTHFLVRGDFLQPDREVQPNTLAVLHPLKTRHENPDRLDLARWLIDPANPLTARVIVNRVWQRYFGRGIVPSVNDFGTQGEKPSHPELLDWLATQFRENGWSFKELHRLIVTSATYRQSSAARPELADRDPYNAWLSRQNRLRAEAEIVRDLALSVSGLIEHKIGGPSVRPQQPKGIAGLGYANSVKWQTSKGGDKYRRGLYTFFQRTVPYPMLMTFDAPDSNLACTKRERSNTPLQALTLWNDPVFFECAQALGRRIVREVPKGGNAESTIEERIRHAFELTLARQPSPEEMSVVRKFYVSQRRLCQSNPEATSLLIGADKFPERTTVAELGAWIIIGRTLINTDEFITRG